MRIEITNTYVDNADELLRKYPLLSQYNPKIISDKLDNTFSRLFIEINTLDELRKLSMKLEQDIIYSRQKSWSDEFLAIYD